MFESIVDKHHLMCVCVLLTSNLRREGPGRGRNVERRGRGEGSGWIGGRGGGRTCSQVIMQHLHEDNQAIILSKQAIKYK